MNDVDIEMAEMAQRGNDVANGVCPICEDALNPLAARWAGETWPKTRCLDGTYRETTAQEYAACVGPESREYPWCHAACVEDGGGW